MTPTVTPATAWQHDKETMMEEEFLHGQIGVLSRQLEDAKARAKAAEARVAGMCDLYNHQSDMLDVAKDRAEAAEAEVERLRVIAREALAYVSPHNYDVGTEDYEQIFRAALNDIASPV